MRLERLTIHNIASIDDATIDFAGGPLASEAVFLICGPTGSGKSTILDAICLALYNNSPRLQNAPNENYSDITIRDTVKRQVRIDDPRTLMRRGAGEASVDLSFFDNSNRRFTASWRCHRARNKADGTLGSVSWTLSEGPGDGIVVASGIRETSGRIMELTGLNFEQFRRTTLLAQGEFARFLTSGADDKSAILEKLTGTGIYTEISRRIQKNFAEKRDAVNSLRARIDAVELLSDEDRATRVSRLAEIGSRVKEAEIRLQKVTSAVEAIVRLAEAVRSEQSARAAVEALRVVRQSEQSVARDADIALWDSSESLREAMRRRQRLSDEAEQIRIIMADTHPFRHALASLDAVRAEYAFRQRKVEEMRKSVSAHLEYAGIYAESQAIGERLEQMETLMTENERRNLSIRKSLADSDRIKSLLETDTNALASAETSAIGLSGEADRAADTLRSLDEENVRRMFAEADRALDALRRAQTLLAAYSAIAESLRRKQREEVEQTARLKAAEKECGLAIGRQKLLDEKFAAATELYDRQRESTGDFLKELRSTLHEGDSCPLCGQKIASLTSTEAFESLLAPLKESLDRARSERDSGVAELAGLKAAVSEASALSDRIRRHVGELKKEFDSTASKVCADPLAVEMLRDDRTVDSEKLENSLSVATGRKESLSARIHAIDEARRRLDNAVKRRDEAVGARDRLKKKTEQTMASLASAEAEREALGHVAAETEEKVRQLGLHIRNLLTNPVWFDGNAAGLKAAVKAMQEDARAYDALVREIPVAEQNLDSIATTLANIDVRRQTLLRLRPQWSGLDAAGLEADYARALTLWQEVEQKVAVDDQRAAKIAAERAEADAVIASWSDEHGEAAKERVARLMERGDIERLRKEKEQADALWTEASTALGLMADNLEAARRSADGIDPEARVGFESEAAGLKAEIAALHTETGTITNELEADRRMREANEMLIAELAAKTEEYNVWSRLNDLFGSADGKKLRNIAQSHILEQLTRHANRHLRRMSSRYELGCQPGSLTLLIQDNDAGGNLRPATNLSGGESFVVSLALALGLPGLSGRATAFDTIFIDEGFGTLDAEVRSVVVDTLESLHHAGGCRVGLISHVETLRERIAVQLRVERTSPTTSCIRVVDTGAV